MHGTKHSAKEILDGKRHLVIGGNTVAALFLVAAAFASGTAFDRLVNDDPVPSVPTAPQTLEVSQPLQPE